MAAQSHDRRVGCLCVVVCGCLTAIGTTRASTYQFHVYEGQSIQAAIDWVTDGAEIIVHPGTYYEAIDLLGKAITVRSENPEDPWVVQSTIINGNGAYHVVECGSGETPATIVAGFTITGGNANGGPSDDFCGGGVCCTNNSSPTLAHCMIRENQAEFGGGISCRVSSNPTLVNCTISNNLVVWAHGGGVYCQHDSHPTLTNCMISDNSAPLFGGGMCCQDGCNPTLTDCTISGNSVNDGDGGGMLFYGGSPMVTDCTILGNTAGCGGGMACYGTDSILTNCTISGNSAAYSGGGIWCYGDSPILTNCTISGNSAGRGGGVCCEYISSPTLTNCTIAGNSADEGGGVDCVGDATPSLTNCILWADSPQEVFVDGGGAVIAAYCDVQDGWEGQGNVDADPLFVDPDNSDYHLSAGSPCIDAGDNTAVPDWVTTDLDGNPRFVDDPDTEDTGFGDPPIVDMGACEFQGESCPADVNDNDVVDIDDLFDILAHWGVGPGTYDVNDDGLVNIDDIFAVLAAWGPCP